MTVTEDAPAAAPAVSQPTATTPAATGLASILGTGDHKVVGRVWIAASLLHLAVAGRRRPVRGGPADRPDRPRQRLLRPGRHAPVDRRHLPLPPAAHHRPRHARRAAPGRRRHDRLPAGGGRGRLDLPPRRRARDRRLRHRRRALRQRHRRRPPVHRRLPRWCCWPWRWRGSASAPRCWRSAPAGMSLRRVPLFAWSSLVGATVWLVILPSSPASCWSPTSTSATAAPTASSAAAVPSPSTAASPGRSASPPSTPSPSRCSASPARWSPCSPHPPPQHRTAMFLIGALRRARRRRLGRARRSAPTPRPGSTRRRGSAVSFADPPPGARPRRAVGPHRRQRPPAAGQPAPLRLGRRC